MSDERIRELARAWKASRADVDLERWALGAARQGAIDAWLAEARAGIGEGLEGSFQRELARYFWRREIVRAGRLEAYQREPNGVGLVVGDVLEWSSSMGQSRRRYRVVALTGGDRPRAEPPRLTPEPEETPTLFDAVAPEPSGLVGVVAVDNEPLYDTIALPSALEVPARWNFTPGGRTFTPGGRVTVQCIGLEGRAGRMVATGAPASSMTGPGLRHLIGVGVWWFGRIERGNRGAKWMGRLVVPFDPRTRRALLTKASAEVQAMRRRRIDRRMEVRAALETTWCLGADEEETRAHLARLAGPMANHRTMAVWLEARDMTGWMTFREKVKAGLVTKKTPPPDATVPLFTTRAEAEEMQP